jgi:hypothetical protein
MHRAQGSVGDVVRSYDDGALLCRESTCGSKEVSQLLFACFGPLRVRVDTKQTHGVISRPTEQPDDGTSESGQERQRWRHDLRPAFRTLQRHSLWGQLAQHEHEEREDYRHEHDRGGFRQTPREVEGPDKGFRQRHRCRRRSEESLPT